MAKISRLLLRLFLTLGAVGSGTSAFSYYLLPEGTAKWFNGGEISQVTSFWVRTVAAGDMLYAYLCVVGLVSSAGLQQVVVRGLWIYAMLHFSAFYIGHHQGPAHPAGSEILYITSLLLHTAAGLWWGFISPPRDEVVNAKKD